MLNKISNFFHHRDERIRANRWMFIVILITSGVSLLAAFMLSIDAFKIAENPDAKLGCSISVFMNCATVAKSSYSAILGFPNSFIGLIGEAVFVTIAIAALMGAKFPKKFMFGVQLAAFGALLFAFALFVISSFIIQVLCPWCLLVFFSTLVMFTAVTRYNICEDNLFLSKKLAKTVKRFVEKDYDKLTLATLIVAIVAFIIIKYGSGLFV